MIIAGTGHRPHKLGGYSKESTNRLKSIAINYLNNISDVDLIVSGMALGWDTSLALSALELQIPLEAAIPFKGQESRWFSESIKEYNNILSKADKITIVCEGGYHPSKMQIRNEYMVDKCDLLLAMWDGSKGGTYNCIKYAKTKNKNIVNLLKS